MAQVRNGFKQTRDEAGRFGSRSEEAFKAFGASAKLAAAGFAGLGILGSTIPSAVKFQQSISEISTLTDEASLNTQFLSDAVIELNARYGGGTAAQAKALYDGISAGASNASESMALMNASNRLAVAGKTDVSTALDGLTSSLNAYGQSFENAAEFSDAMFTAVRKGKTTIPELAGVIGRVAPTASALNVEFTTLNASLAAMTSKGLKTEEAATGLKAAFTNIIQPTKDAADEAKRLGVDFSAAAVRTKGFPDLLEEITNSSGFTEDSFSKLFGSTEALNAILALTANGGASFNDTLDAMKHKSGATDKAFDKMSDGLAFQWQRIQGLFENAKISIGEALAPAIKRVGDVIARLLEAFDAIPQPIRNFIVQGLAAAAGAAALAGSLGMLVHGARIVMQSLRFAGGGLSFLSGAFGPVIVVAGIAALAIAAFKVAIDKNLGGLGDTFSNLSGSVSTAWDAMSQLFSSGTLEGPLAEAFQKGDNSAVNFAVKVYLTVERIKNFLSGIADGFSAAIEAARPSFEAFSNALDELSMAFSSSAVDSGEMGAAYDSAGASGKSVGATLGQVATIIVNVMTAGINIANGFIAVWDRISPALDAVGSALGDVGSAMSSVVAAFSSGSSEASGSADVWKSIGAIFGGVIAVGLKLAAWLIGMVAEQLSNFAILVSGVVDIVGGIFEGDWARVWRGMGKVVYSVVSNVIDLVFGMVEGVTTAIDALANAVGGEGTSNLTGTVKGFKDTFKSSVKDMLGVASETTTKGAVSPFGAAAGAGYTMAPQTQTMSDQAYTAALFGAPAGTPAADPAAFAAASAAAMKSAVSGMPAPQTSVKVMLDSEEIASFIKVTPHDGA